MKEGTGTRINKYLSEIGHCSRRAADKLIEQKRVTINGKFPVSATKVTNRDKVRVDGRLVSGTIVKQIYLAFNKPVGIVSTTDTKGEKDNIIDYINYPTRIFPIGRLDKDSEGLIFLTSDGNIVNKILRSENKHEKEYQVTVDKAVTDQFIEKMSSGIPMMGNITRKCKVEKTSTMTFSIVLTQGMNRQIRRMCEYLGYKVKKLKRTRIMNIMLDVPPGQWRELTENEMQEINQLVASSSKTSKSSSKKKASSAVKKNTGGSGKINSGIRAGKSKKKDNSRSSGKPKSAKGKRGSARNQKRGR